MGMDKYKAFFSGKKVREVMEMAHGKDYGIVEHKTKIIKRVLSDEYLLDLNRQLPSHRMALC